MSNKRYLGISAGFHDAGVAVIENGEILFAGHAERYSRIKNDSNLNTAILQEAEMWKANHVAYYERPWMHNLRQLRTGECALGDWRTLPPWTTRATIQQHLGHYSARHCSVSAHSHHLSHAALAFQTSPFHDATAVVIDAIGEFDTISIWSCRYIKGKAKYKKLWSQQYPHSIGLFYTAMTQHVGLKPNEDEYILMGMASYGNPRTVNNIRRDFIHNEARIEFNHNFHIGVPKNYLRDFADEFDIAAGAQAMLEHLTNHVFHIAKTLDKTGNLVYAGGVALNCSNNRNLGAFFQNIWIPPNPGDCGSALGAAALAYGKKLNWRNAYLGHNIDGEYPIYPVLDTLLTNKIVGVASGRAEWGPRALGNRSLLADPRDITIKDRVNEIKQRQQFRPFAPVILEEQVDSYFQLPPGWKNSRYMQTTATCLYPKKFPAIVHTDGTSRVQTVPQDGSGIRELLERWFVMTGCPMLLNTSLNIKGEPMVNDEYDAQRFEKKYNVKVFS